MDSLARQLQTVAFVTRLAMLAGASFAALNSRAAEIVRFPLPIEPHTETFRIQTTTNLALSFVFGPLGPLIHGFHFLDRATNAARFYRVARVPLAGEEIAAFTAANRLANGPTPELKEQIRAAGVDRFVADQLRPENIVEDPALDDAPALENGWQFVSITGTGVGSELYVNLDEGGHAIIDRMSLVKGTVPEGGPNLLRNGDFEEPLGAEWQIGKDCIRSQRITSPVKSGQHAFRLTVEFVQMRDNAVWQRISPPLDPLEVYTLSYWYYRETNRANQLVTYLSGGGPGYGLSGSPDDALALNTKVKHGLAMSDDLRAWHILRAIKGERQLLEVLLQFWDNHFVTAITKSFDFFANVYTAPVINFRAAVHLEYKELERWRRALLNADCTFHDLLRISAESPAMILYLDTYSSRANDGAVPNENYARELLELFTFGVDNGYDQEDINALARAWSGWTVRLVDWADEGNPFATLSTNQRPGFPAPHWHNLLGTFSFAFEPLWHDPAAKTVFRNKVVPNRFGPPHAGRSYELLLPARAGTNGIQDGYEVLAHLANQPFTQEYLAVKLCRLFVHDDFRHGYDFTEPNLTPEARLVLACMRAWEKSEPKGKIRDVLATIFNSELFRLGGAAQQKIKSPLEYTVSAVRAMRTRAPDGRWTADSDGYGLTKPLERMGRMLLFDRADPDGFPEEGAPMINASTLVERIRYAQALLSPPGPLRPDDAGSSWADPVPLLRAKLPAANWSDPEKIVEYFLDLLFSAEGKANLGAQRLQAIDFLNRDERGVPSPFRDLSPGGHEYDLRVRGMVAHLLSSPRFQEQ